MIELILKNLIEINSSILYGFGISVILLVLMLGILAFMNNRKKFTILSYGIALLLVPFLSFQMSRFCGAIETRYALDDITEITSTVKSSISDATGMSEEDTNEAFSIASSFIPGISDIVDDGTGLSQLSGAMLEKAYSYLNWYIARRALWSLGFILIGAILIAITMKRPYRGHGEYVAYDSNATSSTNEFGF